jgi:glycosyltransferase involved in cell wall biosynthesis
VSTVAVAEKLDGNASNSVPSLAHDAVVAVVTPYEPALSETFIRAHIERLPAKTVLIAGRPPRIESRTVLSMPERAAYKMRRALLREGLGRETTAAYVRAFRRHGVEAVLAEYGTTGVLVMDACRQLGLPLTVHFHGYDASVRSLLEENAEAYREMFRRAAAIIAVSEAMRRKLISLGAPPANVHLIPCGVDCTAFDGSDPASAPPVLLAVGRFIEKKAPHITIEAFSKAHRVLPQARLRMVGDGPLLDDCRRLAKTLGIGDAVTFLGAQSHAVVRDEMRRARSFVQHSVEAANGDCEGMPVAILEACASGLPVVATRHAGIPDVVVDGETGFLVDERDTDAMAARMISLLHEAELARRLGEAARRRTQSRFSTQQSDGRLWAVIQSLLSTARTNHDPL